MIQALVHDLKLLENAYGRCVIDIDAYRAYRQHVIERAEEILRELDSDSEMPPN